MRSPFENVSRETTPFKKKGNWKCGYHTGVDRVCDKDKTIVAIADGVVQRINDCGESYGNHVVYRTNGGIVVLCAHLANKPTVKVGDKIKLGQKIGIMGNTGHSTGPHLHIELQKAEKWAYAKNLLNPNDYIDWNNCAEGDFVMKQWKNGSTSEPVYGSVQACKSKSMKTDELAPRKEAICTAIVDGCYLIVYTANGTKKCGFVAYHGGVR